MKRLLTILFILAGLGLAHTAHAQTDGDKKKKKKEAVAKDSTAAKHDAPAPGGSGGSGGITIDEGGQSRPTRGPKKPAATATQGGTNAEGGPAEPKKEEESDEAAEKSAAPQEAPAPMAIDEGGLSRPGAKPTSSDSTTVAPASGLERPKE